MAIIQIQNEDSLFFWTTMGIKPAQRERLERMFGEWLVKKHGSLAAAQKAWDGVGNEGDQFARGRVGLLGIWPMTQPQTGGMAKRVADEVEFYAETCKVGLYGRHGYFPS